MILNLGSEQSGTADVATARLVEKLLLPLFPFVLALFSQGPQRLPLQVSVAPQSRCPVCRILSAPPVVSVVKKWCSAPPSLVSSPIAGAQLSGCIHCIFSRCHLQHVLPQSPARWAITSNRPSCRKDSLKSLSCRVLRSSCSNGACPGCSVFILSFASHLSYVPASCSRAMPMCCGSVSRVLCARVFRLLSLPFDPRSRIKIIPAHISLHVCSATLVCPLPFSHDTFALHFLSRSICLILYGMIMHCYATGTSNFAARRISRVPTRSIHVYEAVVDV